MERILNDPHHWEVRAREARIQAENITNADTKRDIIAIAEKYEHMAHLARTHRLTARPANP